MEVYKIYNEEDKKAIFAHSLKEVRNLLDITSAELEELYFRGYLRIKAVEVIVYR